MIRYSTKTVWDIIRPKATMVPWYELVWSSFSILGNSLIVWLIVMGRLTTKESMVAWVLSLDISCVLCSDGVDSKKHLFWVQLFSAGPASVPPRDNRFQMGWCY
ncbi:hypothetical protein LINPERHAP1_LOCUS9105 [Linum perenne]